jgi:hypothetical protein
MFYVSVSGPQRRGLISVLPSNVLFTSLVRRTSSASCLCSSNGSISYFAPIAWNSLPNKFHQQAVLSTAAISHSEMALSSTQFLVDELALHSLLPSIACCTLRADCLVHVLAVDFHLILFVSSASFSLAT